MAQKYIHRVVAWLADCYTVCGVAQISQKVGHDVISAIKKNVKTEDESCPLFSTTCLHNATPLATTRFL